MHRIDTSNCGPLLGAETWLPSILACDPKSQQVFVAETGLPRVKVFDAGGKYVRGFSVGGGVQSMCVIPGEALVVVVSEDVTTSKLMGLKKEHHRMFNATVKPFLDFKPGFEFTVKSKHSIDKKIPPPKLSIAYDAVGGRFLVADSSTSTLRCYSASNGNFLWEKPQPKVEASKGRGKKDQQTASLLLPAALAVDQKQNVYVCDQSADHPAVKVFDSNVQLMYLLGEGKGSGDKNMMTPSGVVLAESRNLALISDRGRNCISVYSMDAAGMTSLSWQFTLLVHGQPLGRQALHLSSTPAIEGPSSLVLNDDDSIWVAYPSIGTVFKVTWHH